MWLLGPRPESVTVYQVNHIAVQSTRCLATAAEAALVLVVTSKRVSVRDGGE